MSVGISKTFATYIKSLSAFALIFMVVIVLNSILNKTEENTDSLISDLEKQELLLKFFNKGNHAFNMELKKQFINDLGASFSVINNRLEGSVLPSEINEVLAEQTILWSVKKDKIFNSSATELNLDTFNQLKSLNLKAQLLLIQLRNLVTNSRFIANLLVLSILAGLFIYFIIQFKRNIVDKLSQIIHGCEAAALGDLTNRVMYEAKGDMGQMASALNKIIENQIHLADFAAKIGEGVYDADYKLVSDKDNLGISLTELRDKLQRVSKEDAARSWTNEVLAKFSEILRAHNDNLTKLSDNVIKNLIHYLKANQGAIFALNESGSPASHELNMVASYAWERKKFSQRTLKVGEGLVGQAAIEGKTIYMNDVPDNYIHITSGIGAANPRSILIVPLISNDILQGVIELASFREFEPFEIECVEKLAENFAATLSTTRVNEHTKFLLEESRRMTENLQTQEEELRQNSEELQATQESLNEKLEEAREEMKIQIQQIEGEKKKNIAILEGCVDGVITFDKFGKVEFYNNAAEQIWGFKRSTVLGNNIKDFIPINIELLNQEYVASYLNGQKKMIDVRTEVNSHNADGDEISVLLTLTKAKVGEEYSFTIFTQKISVELF